MQCMKNWPLRNQSSLEELEVELEEHHRVKLEDMQLDLGFFLQNNNNKMNGHDATHGVDQPKEPTTATFVNKDGFLMESKEDEDNDYVKCLEEELELVTEQVIETEQ
jgi:hypothetical protein